MVRKRGVARTSFARRRVRRVKKYDHHVIPLRFKVQLLDFVERLEPKLYVHVECEVPTMELLQSLGVPTEEWVYYLGFMKRMVKLYRNFTSETLQKEKESLISEYVLRGKDITVLEQVQEVAANCAQGIFELPFTCDDVKACLEGDYSSWAYQWKRGYGGDSNPCYFPHFININESSDFLWIYDHYYWNIQQLKISDGTLLTEFGVLDEGYSIEFINYSLLMQYFAIVRDVGGVPHLQVYKNGTLQQSINLQTACGWTTTAHYYIVTMSTDGKYILVSNSSGAVLEYALFKGS